MLIFEIPIQRFNSLKKWVKFSATEMDSFEITFTKITITLIQIILFEKISIRYQVRN